MRAARSLELGAGRLAADADGDVAKAALALTLAAQAYGEDTERAAKGQGAVKGDDGKGVKGDDGKGDGKGDDGKGDVKGDDGKGDVKGDDGKGDVKGDDGKGDDGKGAIKGDDGAVKGDDGAVKGDDGKGGVKAPEPTGWAAVQAKFELLQDSVAHLKGALDKDAAKDLDDVRVAFDLLKNAVDKKN